MKKMNRPNSNNMRIFRVGSHGCLHVWKTMWYKMRILF